MLIFVVVVGGFLVLTAFDEGRTDVSLLALVLALLTVAPVAVQWRLCRDVAVIDYVQGGVMWVRESPGAIRWGDWGILFTHYGVLDARAGSFEVRSRFLYGLIPYRTLTGQLREVRGARWVETGSPQTTTTLTWTVFLRLADGERKVFDAGGTDRNAGHTLATQLTEGIERLLAESR